MNLCMMDRHIRILHRQLGQFVHSSWRKRLTLNQQTYPIGKADMLALLTACAYAAQHRVLQNKVACSKCTCADDRASLEKFRDRSDGQEAIDRRYPHTLLSSKYLGS